MTRAEFEAFKDCTTKTIDVDIAFAVKGNHASILAASRLKIANPLGVDAKLDIHYNPDEDAKVFTIHVADAGGPICRLCVDNGPHPPFKTSHKHALSTPACPRDNLKLDIVDRADLDGRGLTELFGIFCKLTNITHNGQFAAP